VAAIALANDQNSSDYGYSKSDKLDQMVWPFSVGVLLFKKT
jgi:hypothetical protein